MDVDNSDGETKIKSEGLTSSSSILNRQDDKASNSSSTTSDASVSSKINTSDSVPVMPASDRTIEQKPSESILLASSTSSATTSTPFSLMPSASSPSIIEDQSCNVNKVSVSSCGVITSDTVSGNPSVVDTIGDNSMNDVNIKEEIIDPDSPCPNLPLYAVSKHSVSGI